MRDIGAQEKGRQWRPWCFPLWGYGDAIAAIDGAPEHGIVSTAPVRLARMAVRAGLAGQEAHIGGHPALAIGAAWISSTGAGVALLFGQADTAEEVIGESHGMSLPR